MRRAIRFTSPMVFATAAALTACQPSTPAADAGSDTATGACPTNSGAVMEHRNTTITANETWGPGLHLIPFDVSVRMGATLTIAPCAVVRVRAPYGLDVLAGSTLVAEGTEAQPIRFESETAGQPWRQIQVSQGQARLAYVTLEGGGEVPSDPSSAALSLRGDSGMAVAQPVARVVHVTIRNAAKYGVRLESNATFTGDSDDLTIDGAGRFPVLTHPGGVGSIPAGHYTGNAVDEILVLAGSVEWDMTMADRGVPYHIGSPAQQNTSFRVTGSAIPLLTIAPGVVLRFERLAVMEVEHFAGNSPAHGALHAVGTAARPVLFTSAAAAPVAGDWVGIWFGGTPDPRDRIENARVEYAGAASGAENFSCANPAAPVPESHNNRAAVLVMGVPTTAFVAQTAIVRSAGDGIERGWTGGPIDFAAGNTFTNVAWCHQSFPRPQTGACPDPAPCDR